MNEEINPWKTLSKKEVYDNAWINLEEHQVINPNGGKGIYGKVHFKNIAIGIVVLDNDFNTYLVGQYRYPVQSYSWEIPEGGGLLNTAPLDSAKRELLEETGLVAKNWQEIQRIHLSNSVSDELGIIFLARELTQEEAEPEETEQLIVKKLPFAKAFEMVLNNEITDSMSVIGLLKTKYLLNL